MVVNMNVVARIKLDYNLKYLSSAGYDKGT